MDQVHPTMIILLRAWKYCSGLGRLQRAQIMHVTQGGLDGVFGVLESWESRQIKVSNKSIYICIYYVPRSLPDRTRREGLVMCDGDHAAQVAVVVWWMALAATVWQWPTEFGRRMRKDRGRSEGRRPAGGARVDMYRERMCFTMCTSVVGVHMSPGRQVPRRVPCHARGCPRRILIRSEKREGPFRAWAPFLGYVLALPPVSGAPTKEPFSSPPAQFLSRRGH